MATGRSDAMWEMSSQLKREENAQPKIPKTNDLSPYKYPFSPQGSEGSPILRSVFASPRTLRLAAGSGRRCSKLLLPPCLDTTEVEWEDEELGAAAQPLPPIYVSGVPLSVQERVSLYCEQILRHCKAEELDEALCRFLFEKLKKKNKWIGVWKANPKFFFQNYEENAIQCVALLVEVTCKPTPNVSSYLIAKIRLVEPFSSNIANIQRELIDDFLEQLGHCVPLLEIYPIEGQDDDTCEIAQALEIVRYGEIQDGNIPCSIAQRFKRTLEKYRNKRLELIEFHSKIMDDPSVSEAVDCWSKYYEVQLLGGLLKIWENLKLREVKEYSPETLLQQHNNLVTALENSYCGDTVLIFPGEYKAIALAMLTDDITIKGIGKKEEIMITSHPSSDNFVVSRAENLKIINLTLRQKGTVDGIVVVESGHLILQDCDLQCDGTGICVLTGAALFMKDCEISGSQGAGIELYPGSGAILEGNKIHNCNNFRCTDGLGSIQGGGIKIKVIPAPVVKLTNNHIYNNKGHGITIVQPKRRLVNTLEDAGAGDKKEEDVLTAAIESLSLDVGSNKLEENSLGNVGTVLT
ncbi:hypothetical protein GDO78_009166 [Eleutherodactylus coqui]|uniref:Testicular spindle-associated protein SHCBP1L n=1 Tax=Eleutherodactylus coqui TaxID=57060 RepID=A0A8J6FAI5_ELECQ|nr:hypothetical protein GDO78_009166 [Eleutherodactylus coqui]